MAIIFDNNSNHRSRQRDHADNDSMDCLRKTIMFGKFRVDHMYPDLVALQLEKVRPFLLRDTYYTCQDLLGEEFGSDLPDFPSHLICVCLQHIAAQPETQLKVLPSRGGEPTYFRIR
jgi:hypothetical protein